MKAERKGEDDGYFMCAMEHGICGSSTTEKSVFA